MTHTVLVECRPDIGSLRVWVDKYLYGIGNTITRLSIPPLAWVNPQGFLVNASQPIAYYQHQAVSFGTNRLPVGLPGTMPAFGIDVGASLPSFRI